MYICDPEALFEKWEYRRDPIHLMNYKCNILISERLNKVRIRSCSKNRDICSFKNTSISHVEGKQSDNQMLITDRALKEKTTKQKHHRSGGRYSSYLGLAVELPIWIVHHSALLINSGSLFQNLLITQSWEVPGTAPIVGVLVTQGEDPVWVHSFAQSWTVTATRGVNWWIACVSLSSSLQLTTYPILKCPFEY